MKRVTFYLSEETIALVDHLYALRIIDRKKATRSEIVAQALVTLADVEKKKA